MPCFIYYCFQFFFIDRRNLFLSANHVLKTDLKAQYEVRLEEGLDAFVVIDGLPIVPEESKPRLVKFLLKKLNTVGRTSEDAIFMPMNENKMSEGCVQTKIEKHQRYNEAVGTLRLIPNYSMSIFSDLHLLNTSHPNRLSRPRNIFTALPWIKSTHWLLINLRISIGMDVRAVLTRNINHRPSSHSKKRNTFDRG